MDLNSLIIKSDSSIKLAMNMINMSGIGFLFIVDIEDKMIGIISDGDIRRDLLKNNDLNRKVDSFMNTEFIWLPYNSDSYTIMSKLNQEIKIIPLLDDEGKVLDYASRDKIKKIPISSPDLNGNELLYLKDCIDSNWVSSTGKYVSIFENLFSEYFNGREAISVSNGTAALHLALLGLGIKKNDEVILPNITFAATINSVLYTGAKPILVDIEKESWNINPALIEEKITEKTKAIIVVHLYGYPCKMNLINKIAKKNNLFLIEDCAEAIGSRHKNIPVGLFGDVSTFSFFGNKTITTGEGGMVIFEDHLKADLARKIRDHGMSKQKRYWHEIVGYNYRLTNLQAAVGVAQMERLDFFIQRKREISKKYENILKSKDDLILPKDGNGFFNSYWLYTFVIRPNPIFNRDILIKFLENRGIEARRVFYPLNRMPPYLKCSDKELFEVSNFFSENALSLSSSYSLSDNEVEYICSSIDLFFKNLK